MIEDCCWIGYKLDDMLHTMKNHTTIVVGLDCAPWWLHTSDMIENYLKKCAMPSHTILVTDSLTIDPMLICMDPGWIPLGEMHPNYCCKCTLEIPLSKFADNGLKMCALVTLYWVGRVSLDLAR